jgi:hypothetical protein
MFARAVSAPRLIPCVAAALAVLSGCGGQRQDADEPSGTFKVDVAGASFPAQQHVAEQSTMRIRVRNPDGETVPDVAVTVETKGARPGDAPVSFAQSKGDDRLADQERAVWILDAGPKGGDSAYTNTWTLGPLKSGQSKTFVWKVTAVEPGDYSISYRVSPGLDNKAKLADGSKATGRFTVNVSDQPVPARVNSKGQVVRGEKAGAGKD